MEKGFFGDVRFTTLNSSLKPSSIREHHRIARLILGCCYILTFTISALNEAIAETHDNPSIESSQPPRTELTRCDWGDAEVACVYVNNDGEVEWPLPYKSITVPAYQTNWQVCEPKPNTFTAMNAACAALGPVNGYPLFASGQGKSRTVQAMLRVLCSSGESHWGWDLKNMVCYLDPFPSKTRKPAQEQGKQMKRGEALQPTTPTQEDHQPIPSNPEKNLNLPSVGERTLQK